MDHFLAELKRRHIYRVGAAYVVVAWVLTQVIDILSQVFDLPSWIAQPVVVLLAIGFPIALVVAWTIESKPHEAVAAAVRSKPTIVDWTLCSALVVVIALVSYQQLSSSPGAAPAQQASVASSFSQPQPGGISIVVLPFANVSGDASREFFSDGMTDEISGALAKVRDLRVIARSSAFQFKGQNQDVRAVGQAVGASHLIEGSVRQAGNRVRITAQLVRAGDGVQLWSENYDRELTDIFAIQEEIAEAIAGALRVPLGLAPGDTLVRDRTKDLESYDQYLRARALVRARGQESVAGAIALLEQVVARDPGFATAWALLAQAYVAVPGNSPEWRAGTIEEARLVVRSSFDKAERAAREAIRLDARNSLAHAMLARTQARRGNWAEAEDLFRQAIALDPGEPDVLQNYGLMLESVGRVREASSIGERVRALEPFVPVYALVTARFMQANGQNAASIPLLEALPSSASGGVNRNSSLAHAYAAEGRYAEAADTLLLIAGNLVSRRSVEDAARLLRSAPTKVSAPASLPELEVGLNFVYAYVGALPRVMEAAERILDIEYNIGAGPLWLPVYAPLRKTERFKTFVHKARLVDYWRARGWPDLCRPMGADDFVCD